jgi:sugar transferase (PEP-CTERM/EpsH1 system associated)
VTQICNGVDTAKFHPGPGHRSGSPLHGFTSSRNFVVGTVGRMEAVKDQLVLVRAFLHLLGEDQTMRDRLRLVIVGDGSLREQALQMLQEADVEQLSWLPGERADIPEIMRSLDLFILPSLREGISNTVLEAMATGLPVVATAVGGNPELVDHGTTGTLIPPSHPIAMAEAIRGYVLDRGRVKNHGTAGRKRVEAYFNMESMVAGYLRVYDSVLREKGHRSETLTKELSAHKPEASG